MISKRDSIIVVVDGQPENHMHSRKDMLIKSLAAKHCNRNGSDCHWYHGNWQLLSSLGVVTSSAVHTDQLQALLLSATPDTFQRPKILLSGSTDETLLQIAAATYGASVRPAEFTALDICATPLVLAQEYAVENELDFSSVMTDILEYCPDHGFDIIFTHAFMGNFDDRDRPRLVQKWASLLNDGGRVVTVQRIRPTDSPPIIRFTVEQSADFIAAAMDAASQHEELQASDLARVEAAAKSFSEHFMSHAIRSKFEMEGLFLDAGMTIHHLAYETLETKRNLAGPSVPSGGEYAFIIAGRD